MQLETIFNRVTNYKPFVAESAELEAGEGGPRLVVQMRSRKNGRPVCSGCGKRRAGYDRLVARRWEFVPLWQIPVVLVYALRRVDCPDCGVVVERVPWGTGRCRQTHEYRWFLAGWARRLSWQEVARIFRSNWRTVYRSVWYAVAWGLVHRDESGVEAIGIDEIQYQRGHKYLTLVYQIDASRRRLLWVAKDRTEKSLERFFDVLGTELEPTLKYVCSDMWKPYLKVVRRRAGEAVQILDRYHIMAKLNKAIDEIRAEESRRLKRDGYEAVLKHSRWSLLKRPSNLTQRQTVSLRTLLQYNLQTVRAYLQREEFQRFWEYRSPIWAGRFLDEWIARVLRSRLEPMKKVARSLRHHRPLLLNWFAAEGRISAGTVEGLNNKAKLTMRKSYGFRTDNAIEVALYHALGDLPEKPLTHRFC
jgi:transposase